MTELRMMSKAWAEKNKSVDPKDFMKAADENFATAMPWDQTLCLNSWQTRPAHGIQKAQTRTGGARWMAM